jgi:hypothetical protein
VNYLCKLVFVATLLFSPFAMPQEIGTLDLTAVILRERLREPKGVGGGSCVGIEHAHYPEISVSLTSLDRPQYTLGEDVVFEVIVRNLGKDSVVLPWAENVADFEPPDPSTPYSYLKGTISLEVGAGKQTFPIFDSFYGMSERPGTLKELRSGESVVIRGRTQLQTSANWVMEEFRREPFMDATVRAGLGINTVRFDPEGNHGKPGEASSCVNMSVRRANQLKVTIFPRPSH